MQGVQEPHAALHCRRMVEACLLEVSAIKLWGSPLDNITHIPNDSVYLYYNLEIFKGKLDYIFEILAQLQGKKIVLMISS